VIQLNAAAEWRLRAKQRSDEPVQQNTPLISAPPLMMSAMTGVITAEYAR